MVPKLKNASAKTIDKNKIKTMVVKKICESKDILFGSFSSKITRDLKAATWKELLDYATSIGFQNNGDWQSLRDTTWMNWSRRVRSKFDSLNKTGGEGGDANELTEFDEAVLDVIGRESAAMVGIGGVTESLEGRDETESATASIQPQTSPIIHFEDPSPHPPTAQSQFDTVSKRKRKNAPLVLLDAQEDDNTLQQLKKEKAALQVQQLKLLNYKTQLEIFDLENRLGFGHKFPVDTPRALNLLHYEGPALDEEGYHDNPFD